MSKFPIEVFHMYQTAYRRFYCLTLSYRIRSIHLLNYIFLRMDIYLSTYGTNLRNLWKYSFPLMELSSPFHVYAHSHLWDELYTAVELFISINGINNIYTWD